MRRYQLTTLMGTGTDADPIRPNLAAGTSWVMLGQRGTRCLVKVVTPDGTAATNTTVADQPSPTTDPTQTDVNLDTLTPAQINAIKTFLSGQGVDTSTFDADGVGDRRTYLRWVLRRWLGWSLSDIQARLHITGFDIGE